MNLQPIHEIRFGRIKAAIWANQVETGVKYNVTFVRIYKDGDQWKDSTSFGREDLPLLAKVVDLSHTWIYQEGKDAVAVVSEQQPS